MIMFLEFFNSLLSTGDDIFKAFIALLTIIFGGTKGWEAIQKWREGDNKIKEAQINADKEIKSNNAKHKAELEKRDTTIKHQKGEIKYKDDIIEKLEDVVKDYKIKNESLLNLNEGKDKEITRLHERLLDCERSKNNN